MREERQRVILYGDSLILAGMRASLEARPGTEVLILDQSLDRRCEALCSPGRATLIFDLGAVDPDSPLGLLQQPGLRLVGIDPETHQALVWSARRSSALNAADLVRVLFQDHSSSGGKLL